MKTLLFKNENSGATIWNNDGTIYFKDAGAKLSSFDLNNDADYHEFIRCVIIGGGYVDGLVKTIREDGIGGQSFEDASEFFENKIKPLLK